MKLSIEMEDGTVYESKASDRTWQCLADRVRFQKRFGVNPVVLQAWQEAAPDDEDDESTVLSRLSDEALRYMQEEHLVFFMHAELNRQVDGGLPSFDEVLENAIDYEIDVSDEPDEVDANPSS